MRLLTFSKEKEATYLGKGKIFFLLDGDYYVNNVENAHNIAHEHAVIGLGVNSLDDYFSGILKQGDPERILSEFLIGLELPSHIEETVIDRFNLAKKKHLLHQDVITKKKQEILRKYK